MAGCDVLYYDPTQRRQSGGRPGGLASDGWRPCTAPGQVWTDPEPVLRWICTSHRHQLMALHTAGLAGQVRWQRPGLATSQASSREATS
jgi:hypothetical protein